MSFKSAIVFDYLRAADPAEIRTVLTEVVQQLPESRWADLVNIVVAEMHRRGPLRHGGPVSANGANGANGAITDARAREARLHPL